MASIGSTPAKPNHSRHDSLTSSTTHEPFTPTAGNHKVKAEATSSRTQSGTHKSRTAAKRTLKDVFAEGSVRENLMLERLGTQKHERAIGEQELKRRKLEHKAMEKRHQREREREQHEFRMMQMRLTMSQSQRATPMNQPSFQGMGLMDELNDGLLPSGSSYSI
jgi:hypothetical protein